MIMKVIQQIDLHIYHPPPGQGQYGNKAKEIELKNFKIQIADVFHKQNKSQNFRMNSNAMMMK